MPRDNSGDEPHKMGEGKCIRESEKAILVAFTSAEGQRWIPKSVVHDDSEVWKQDDVGQLVVKMWWAEKNILDNA